ncbi:MAG: acetyl-CoA carboxylase biotin carboxyl carrier protein [Acidobacteria bacterium]|nr:acetyl-CoA carboxylase biotin carboxyl carrier protein [Acidobacteriota bacterium]
MSKKPSHESLVDLDQIRELIDLLIEKDVSELAIERDGVRVEIRRGTAEISGPAAPANVVSAPAAAIPASESLTAGGEAAAAAETSYEDCFIVVSPMVGTFYRSAEPDADAFTEVGAEVSEGETLCIVEAMKLMNEIVAEAGGEVVAIFVDNAEPVEFGQRLFAIRSSSPE